MKHTLPPKKDNVGWGGPLTQGSMLGGLTLIKTVNFIGKISAA